MSLTKEFPYLSEISNIATTPVQMFKNIIGEVKANNLIMNLATVDKEFGVLNRSVLYRGLTEENPSNICFVTEKSSRKYQNLKDNPKLSLTILHPLPDKLWQIRIFDAEAHELNDDIVQKLWKEEPLFCKIRNNICECGKPNDGHELQRKYEEIVEKYERESEEPKQRDTYTAFKIVPKLWDFYMSEPQKIADRVQYKLIDGETDKWEVYHVDA